MVSKIKHRAERSIPALPFPFPPTQEPEADHIMSAANSVLTFVQILFGGNAGAIITALKAAESVYSEHATEGGLSPEEVEGYEVLGMRTGEVMLARAKEQAAKEDSKILTKDSRIVGVDGNPIVSP